MKISILGTGAIGSLFAAGLADKNSGVLEIGPGVGCLT